MDSLSKSSSIARDISAMQRRFMFPVDRLGIWVSSLCILHCLLTPILLSLSTVLAHIAPSHMVPSEEKTHRLFSFIVAACGLIALLNGYRRHRRIEVVILMGGGLLCIFAGAYCGEYLSSHSVEVMVTLLGSGLMIAAHRRNHTFCQDSCSCDCSKD
jgi:MerC mercury resistance protein